MLSVPTCYMLCSCMLWGKATTVKTDLSSAEHETRISILFHLSHCINILVLEPHFNHISRLTEGVPWRNVTRLWCIRKVVSYCMINSTFTLARRCSFFLVYREYSDPLAHTSTNPTGPEVNDHVNFQWSLSSYKQPQGLNLKPQREQTFWSQALTTGHGIFFIRQVG